MIVLTIMIVIATPNRGNVYIREGPSKQSPSIGIPAYNYNKIGVLYECDEQRSIDGVVWYHLRGLGWSMGDYFKIYEPEEQPDPEQPSEWLIGYTREQLLVIQDYLSGVLRGDD